MGLTACAFLRGRLRGESVLAVGALHTCADIVSCPAPFLRPLQKGAVGGEKSGEKGLGTRLTHKPQVRGQHRVYQKQVSIKRFLKRNLPHVGMAQCMNALVDNVYKQEVHVHM